MPPSRKTWNVYCNPIAAAVVGGNGPALNRAISCWSDVLSRSMPELDRTEWIYLTRAYRELRLSDDDTRSHSGAAMAGCVANAHLLSRLGDKMMVDNGETGDSFVSGLVKKCNGLSWEQVQYALAAMAFFRKFRHKLDPNKDDWWTLPFRVGVIGGE